jgi:hypothetical protein
MATEVVALAVICNGDGGKEGERGGVNLLGPPFG